MKKVYYALFAALTLASCSSEEVFETAENKTEIATGLSISETRSYEEAMAIAQEAISMIENNGKMTRSEEAHRSINTTNGVKVYCQNTTRANGSDANDTLLYVVNFNDNKGFAVVSAKRATEGLLAVIEEGYYDPNSNNGESIAIECLENLKDYVAEAKMDTAKTTRGGGWETHFGNGSIWTGSSDVYREFTDMLTIYPKITVKWGQTGSIARCCPLYHDASGKVVGPGSIAGSGPIALAQIMSYYNQPQRITLSYLDGRDNYNNWPEMKKYNSNNIPDNFFQFPAFIREIGQRTGTTYMWYRSETSMEKMREFMQADDIQYKVSDIESLDIVKEYDSQRIGTLLKEYGFVVAQLSRKGKTHTIAIDGCNYYEERVVRRAKSGREIEVYRTDVFLLNHINWGENGVYNGWWPITSLKSVRLNNSDKNSSYFEGGDLEFESKLLFFGVGR